MSDYVASKDGRIFSHKTNKYLRPNTNNKGYSYVVLRIDGKSVTKLVHRLVAEQHLPNPDNLSEINHIDGNPLNNWLDNLEWCDRSHNVTQTYRMGYKGAFYGKKGGLHHRSRPVLKIDGDMAIRYESMLEAERETGVSHGNISQVLSGKRNTAGGYGWKLC